MDKRAINQHMAMFSLRSSCVNSSCNQITLLRFSEALLISEKGCPVAQQVVPTHNFWVVHPSLVGLFVVSKG